MILVVPLQSLILLFYLYFWFYSIVAFLSESLFLKEAKCCLQNEAIVDITWWNQQLTKWNPWQMMSTRGLVVWVAICWKNNKKHGWEWEVTRKTIFLCGFWKSLNSSAKEERLHITALDVLGLVWQVGKSNLILKHKHLAD